MATIIEEDKLPQGLQEDFVYMSEEEFLAAYFPEGVVITRSEYELLSRLSRAFVVNIGKKGSGKTMLATMLAWKLKVLFGLPVVADFRMQIAFGEHAAISFDELIGVLENLTEVAELDLKKPAEAKFALEAITTKLGVNLHKSIIILDEAYKYLDSRSPSDKVVKLFGYWVSQVRHYKSCLIMMAPHDDMLDKRVRRQMDYLVTCYSTREAGVCITSINDLEDGSVYRFTLDKEKWGQLYESENPLGFRRSSLKVKAGG